MDILFKNSFVRNKEMAKEVYGYYFFKQPTYITIDVLCCFIFLFGLINLIVFKDFNFIMLFVPLFIILLQYMMYNQTVSMLIKRDKETYGDEPLLVDTDVTDAVIKNTISAGNTNEIGFDNVKYAAQTKNFILLFTKAGMIYIFRKDGFTVGTKEGFLDFIRSKGIKVK